MWCVPRLYLLEAQEEASIWSSYVITSLLCFKMSFAHETVSSCHRVSLGPAIIRIFLVLFSCSEQAVYKQVWHHLELGGWVLRWTQSKGIRQHHPHNATGERLSLEVERVPPSKVMGPVETAGKQCVLISYQDKACVVRMRISPQRLCTEYSLLSWWHSLGSRRRCGLAGGSVLRRWMLGLQTHAIPVCCLCSCVVQVGCS